MEFVEMVVAFVALPVLAGCVWGAIHLLPTPIRKKVMKFVDGE